MSGEYLNAPAILIETAVQAQRKEPLLTMNGRMYTDELPEGILEENASRFRFGAMAFNDEGVSVRVDPDKQRELGIFMMGDVGCLNKKKTTIAELHNSLLEGAKSSTFKPDQWSIVKVTK